MRKGELKSTKRCLRQDRFQMKPGASKSFEERREVPSMLKVDVPRMLLKGRAQKQTMIQ